MKLLYVNKLLFFTSIVVGFSLTCEDTLLLL